jgi:hypothetical protein
LAADAGWSLAPVCILEFGEQVKNLLKARNCQARVHGTGRPL